MVCFGTFYRKRFCHKNQLDFVHLNIFIGQAFRINERLSGIHAFSILFSHRCYGAYGIIDNEITSFCSSRCYSSFMMMAISVAVALFAIVVVGAFA